MLFQSQISSTSQIAPILRVQELGILVLSRGCRDSKTWPFSTASPGTLARGRMGSGTVRI